jgi:urease accessory protein
VRASPRHGARREATGSLPAYFAGFLAASAMLHAGGWQAGRTIFARGQGRVVAGLALGITGLALLAS